jgi:hypothetical protein
MLIWYGLLVGDNNKNVNIKFSAQDAFL